MTDPFEPEFRNFVAQGLSLHCTDWGNPDAATVILLHGGLDHGRNWDWVAQALRSEFHILVPDLRGHGDSAWSPDGDYAITSYVGDLVVLIEQLGAAKVTLIGHSLGGNVAVRYAAAYPEKVERLVAIEGLRPPPEVEAHRASQTAAEHLREWLDERLRIATCQPRRYASIDEALARMQAMNGHLTDAQARHLTEHAVRGNGDGSYSWKFDDRVRSFSAADFTDAEMAELYAAITCPTLLVYGRDSWATNPAEDGRLAQFRHARVAMFDNAGHWVHHDRLDAFIAEVRSFLTAI